MDNFKYTKVVSDTAKAVACPVCGAEPEIYRCSASETAPTTVAVMCTTNQDLGPQQDGVGGCLLYLPPPEFYRSRIIEAVKYWNEYAQAITELRKSNTEVKDSNEHSNPN